MASARVGIVLVVVTSEMAVDSMFSPFFRKLNHYRYIVKEKTWTKTRQKEKGSEELNGTQRLKA